MRISRIIIVLLHHHYKYYVKNYSSTAMIKRHHLSVMLFVLLFLQVILARADAPKDYELNYTIGLDTVGHYLNVRLDYAATTADTPELVLNMPVWTPGYYEILNFPKHLCDFSASDVQGQPLTWRKEGMNRWRISLPADRRATISYRIYANRRDVA